MVICNYIFTGLQLVPHKGAISWGTCPKNYVVSVVSKPSAGQGKWSSFGRKTTLTTQISINTLFYYSSWGTLYIYLILKGIGK